MKHSVSELPGERDAKDSARRRVLILVENNPYPQDTRIRAEAEALRDAGYQVSVIAPAAKRQRWRESLSGVRVYRFPMPFEARGFLGYVWEFSYATVAMFLLSLLVWVRDGFDVLHAANPPDTPAFIAAFYKLFGKRFIFDHHDLAPELYDANSGGEGSRLVYNVLVWLEKLSCRLADHIIATNESYKEMEMVRSGVPEHRITIVRNGPDLERLRPVDPDPGLRAAGKTVIAYVGAMGPHDGLDYLLRALKHLTYDLGRRDFTAILIGKGEAVENLSRLTGQLGLKGHVTFTGWVSEADKLRYLSSADICVDPDPGNPFNDRSTMIKIAEYMALGKPIVGFSLRENCFTAQEAGLFVRPNDELEFARALAQLMDDPPRRYTMGAFGRRRVELDLAWTHSVPRLLTAYWAALGREDGRSVELGVGQAK
jgi:glycosyltransferase involved in cell wall biosynthesis